MTNSSFAGVTLISTLINYINTLMRYKKYRILWHYPLDIWIRLQTERADRE